MYLRRDPALMITATLTLAVAIGANTTVFSLVDSILLRPLPFPDASRIALVPMSADKSHVASKPCGSAAVPSRS